MRIGRVLLTAGILLSLGAGAMASVQGNNSAEDTATVSIEIIKPLSVKIEGQEVDFGIYTAEEDLNGKSLENTVTVTGEDRYSVDLAVEGSNLVNSNGETELEMNYELNKYSMVIGDSNPVLKTTIEEPKPVGGYTTGSYTGEVTVTATYN